MTDKLKPCPFCGGEAEEHLNEIASYWAISCETCVEQKERAIHSI